MSDAGRSQRSPPWDRRAVPCARAMSAVLPPTAAAPACRHPRRQAAVAEPARVGALQAQPHRLLCRCWSSSRMLVVATLAEAGQQRPAARRALQRQVVLRRCSATRPKRGSAATSRRRPTGRTRSSTSSSPSRATGRCARSTRTRRRRPTTSTKRADPAPPSARELARHRRLGRDMVARLLYGFRVSIWFALALTVGRHRDRHR